MRQRAVRKQSVEEADATQRQPQKKRGTSGSRSAATAAVQRQQQRTAERRNAHVVRRSCKSGTDAARPRKKDRSSAQLPPPPKKNMYIFIYRASSATVSRTRVRVGFNWLAPSGAPFSHSTKENKPKNKTKNKIINYYNKITGARTAMVAITRRARRQRRRIVLRRVSLLRGRISNKKNQFLKLELALSGGKL